MLASGAVVALSFCLLPQAFAQAMVRVRVADNVPPQSAYIKSLQDKYKGTIRAVKKKNGRVTLINHVPLEDYVKGILLHEASHYWPKEAIEAQAIVCRTFALYQMQERKHALFDVTADVYSQVYGGSASERYRTNEAVDATSGLVLKYKGALFPAYFHSTCAGHTEDAHQLWNISIPPLRGVRCGFCYGSPRLRWDYRIAIGEAEKILQRKGLFSGSLSDIRIERKDASGRIVDLSLVGKHKRTIAGKDFREAIGPDKIRSLNFTIAKQGGAFVMEGLGWGHGVGLCQWGAYFMAKQGRTFKDIVQHYYPGADIAQLTTKTDS
ncbi:MAG: SpoIID/LytB domain-containing protein [Candidatus Omnitrophica bacterium]|nr:SpoIID/LytB domain-containing protein [Candidatus Omnitrophota bacterium]